MNNHLTKRIKRIKDIFAEYIKIAEYINANYDKETFAEEESLEITRDELINLLNGDEE